MIRYRLSEISGRPSETSGSSFFFLRNIPPRVTAFQIVVDMSVSESYLQRFASKAEIKTRIRH